jgi:hypothetical protein
MDVQEITDFTAISESEAEKLKKISPAGTHHDGSVFPRRAAEKLTGIFRVWRSMVYSSSRRGMSLPLGNREVALL